MTPVSIAPPRTLRRDGTEFDPESRITEIRPPRRGRTIGSRLRGWALKESFLVGVSAFAVYLVGGILLDFVYRSMPGDAVSRMANGYYVLYARDPHLAAIGFVWTPLTSIADLVPLLFKGLWPALATHDFAGTLVTAISMTGAVHQVRAALQEWGLGRAARITTAALFALSPMIVFFAANGMSEAVYMFALVAATRYLLRWVRDDDSRSLVFAAASLGFAYLARNETVASAFLATLLVLVVSFARAGSGVSKKGRTMTALTDAVIVVSPFAATFAGWATASFVITKHPFQQFQGNSVLVKASGFKPGAIAARLTHEAQAILALAPAIVLVFLVALLLAGRRRDFQVLVPVATLGGGLAFSMFSYFDGLLFPWFRYYILAIPLGVFLLGYVLSSLSEEVRSRARRDNSRGVAANGMTESSRGRMTTRSLGVALPTVVAFLALAPSLPTSAQAMLRPDIGAGETVQYLGFIFHRHLTSQDEGAEHNYASVQAIDRYIAHLGLPEGSIVVDNDVSCVPEIITTISDGRVFVIPNDRDFQRILADPVTFHAHYLFVPTGTNNPDLVDVAYPGLGAQGNQMVQLVHAFRAGGGCPTLRLYRIVRPRPGP